MNIIVKKKKKTEHINPCTRFPFYSSTKHNLGQLFFLCQAVTLSSINTDHMAARRRRCWLNSLPDSREIPGFQVSTQVLPRSQKRPVSLRFLRRSCKEPRHPHGHNNRPHPLALLRAMFCPTFQREWLVLAQFNPFWEFLVDVCME